MEAPTDSAVRGVQDLAFEFMLAGATLTLWPLVDERACGAREQRARSMVFIPIAGFALGIIFASIDRALGIVSSLLVRSIAVLALAAIASAGLSLRGIADSVESIRRGARPASTGLARIGPLGAAAAVAWFAGEAYLLAKIADPAGRASALVMMNMLGRWTIVPVGYGLQPRERWGLGVPYEGGITFREFGISSVVALGVTMALYQNVGLAAIVALALAILAMRLVLSRRLGGAAGYALAGASAAAEITVLAALAALRV